MMVMTDGEDGEAKVDAFLVKTWGPELASLIRQTAGPVMAGAWDEDWMKLRSWQMSHGNDVVRDYGQLLESLGVNEAPLDEQQQTLLKFLTSAVAQKMPYKIKRKVRRVVLGPQAGDSTIQSEAEAVMLSWLSSELGVEVLPKRLNLGDSVFVELDGYSGEPPVAVEAFAHQGPVKGGQVRKVMTDAMKLISARAVLGNDARLVLLFADPVTAAHFKGRGWHANALATAGIESYVAPLPDELRVAINVAQVSQYR